MTVTIKHLARSRVGNINSDGVQACADGVRVRCQRAYEKSRAPVVLLVSDEGDVFAPNSTNTIAQLSMRVFPQWEAGTYQVKMNLRGKVGKGRSKPISPDAAHIAEDIMFHIASRAKRLAA